MEKIFVLIILVAMTTVYGGRLEWLEKKVIGMEMSLHQDIVMLRGTVQTINDKLDKILQLNLSPQESDVPNTVQTSTVSHDKEKPALVSSYVGKIRSEMRRLKRAFSHIKYDVKSNQEINTINLSKSLTRTRNIINETMNDIRDNVISVTTKLNYNVSSFINETSNRALSLVEAATTERQTLIENITNIINSDKAREESTARILKVNKDILNSVKEFEVNYYSLLSGGSLSHQQIQFIHDNIIHHGANCTNDSYMCNSLNKILIQNDDFITYLITNQDNVRLGDYTIDRTSNTVRGRLEVFYNNTWGTVCDDYFYGTQVACRQLGLTGGTPIPEFGSGIGPIWLDNVICKGTESNIFLCPRYDDISIGSHDCQHSEDVGVECTIRDYFI